MEAIVRFSIDEHDLSEVPNPVFDEFRKVFILTRGNESFYVDVDGNYDRACGLQIEWSSPPSSLVIARPYLIAFIE